MCHSLRLIQAWSFAEVMETMASAVLVLASVPLKNVPIDILTLEWKCLLFEESGLAPTIMQFQLHVHVGLH